MKLDPQCFGKTKYRSKGAAAQRIIEQNKRKPDRIRRGQWAGRDMSIYRCPRCHFWHVGGTMLDHRPKPEAADIWGLELLPASAAAKWGRA